MGEKEFAALQRGWFRQLTTCSAITAAGFTVLLAGLGVWLQVKVLLLGGGVIGAVFVFQLIALALAASDRLLLGATARGGRGRRPRDRTVLSVPVRRAGPRRIGGPVGRVRPAVRPRAPAAVARRLEHVVFGRDCFAPTPVDARRRRPVRGAAGDRDGGAAGRHHPDLAAAPAVQRAHATHAERRSHRPVRRRADAACARNGQPAPSSCPVGRWHRHLGRRPRDGQPGPGRSLQRDSWHSRWRRHRLPRIPRARPRGRPGTHSSHGEPDRCRRGLRSVRDRIPRARS